MVLSGDEDLRIGVAQAQELGVRVHLLGVEPAWQTQSASLMQESDTVQELTRADLEVFLRCAEGRATPRATTTEAWHAPLAERVAADLTAEERQVIEQVLYELRMRFVEIERGDPRIILP